MFERHTPQQLRHHEAMKILVSYRADVNAGVTKAVYKAPLGMAGMSNDVVGVRMLLQFRADPYMCATLARQGPLNSCCAGSSMDTVEEMLKQVPDVTIPSLVDCTIRHAKIVQRLIDARADVNERYAPPVLSLPGMFLATYSMLYRTDSSKTRFRTWAYHHHGGTPLMIHIICGNWDVAAVLIANGARLDVRNSRGRSAADFARESSAPEHILSAFEAETGKCQSLVPWVLDRM